MENNTKNDVDRFLKTAEQVNFYSTLIIMAVGIVFNLMIFYILVSKPRTLQRSLSRLSHRNRSGVRSRSLSSSELYMCALAIVDTLFLLSYLLFNRAPSLVNNLDIFQMAHDSRIACKLANYLRYTSRFCSSYFVVFFAYERFAAVRRPLQRIKSDKSRILTKVFIIGVFTLSILINSYSPLLFDLDTDEQDASRTICSIKLDNKYRKFYRRWHSPFQFAISFIIPILLVWFFNISNIRVLLTRKSELIREVNGSMMSNNNSTGIIDSPLPNNNNDTTDSIRMVGSNIRRRSSKHSIVYMDRFKDSNRATNILIFISVCFVGLNLPFVLTRAWHLLNLSTISLAFLCLAEILHVVNFAINFPLYCFASKQFRDELKARFCCCH